MDFVKPKSVASRPISIDQIIDVVLENSREGSKVTRQILTVALIIHQWRGIATALASGGGLGLRSSFSVGF